MSRADCKRESLANFIPDLKEEIYEHKMATDKFSDKMVEIFNSHLLPFDKYGGEAFSKDHPYQLFGEVDGYQALVFFRQHQGIRLVDDAHQMDQNCLFFTPSIGRFYVANHLQDAPLCFEGLKE